MIFEDALKELKLGKKVCRPSWKNDKKKIHYIQLNEFGDIVEENGFSPSVNVTRDDYEVLE